MTNDTERLWAEMRDLRTATSENTKALAVAITELAEARREHNDLARSFYEDRKQRDNDRKDQENAMGNLKFKVYGLLAILVSAIAAYLGAGGV